MNYIFVALLRGDISGGIPIASSDDFDVLKEMIDEYFGDDTVSKTYYAHSSKYPTTYEGYFEYETKSPITKAEDIDKDVVDIYCIDFNKKYTPKIF